MYQYFEFKPTELLIKETIEEINNIVEDGLDEDEKKLIKRELGLLTRRVLNEVIELAGKLK